eukprot:TRINITY_DN38343_c0_g1_i2.p1 TRINITY_DN38343_c0_g1~~TRINITY_DN38343_c0_g1_i2.p1  ORF type:complete len:259 (-),score=33.65 TRINITY_DN38343_c0_g1_i2:2-778(-)
MATAHADPLLIAGGYCSELRFLDALRGDLRHTVTVQDFSHVNRLAVSSDVHHLAVAGNPNVRLFDMKSGPPSMHIGQLEGHINNVTAVGFEAIGGRWLYTGSEDGTMRVWDCRTRKCQLTFENDAIFDRTAIHSVELHPNQVELIAGDNQGKVMIWDLQANRIRQTLIPEDGVPVRSVCVSPDGRVAVCANHEGTCYVWKMHDVDETYEPLQKIDAHGTYVLCCTFSPEAFFGAGLIAGGGVRTCRNPETSRAVVVFQ